MFSSCSEVDKTFIDCLKVSCYEDLNTSTKVLYLNVSSSTKSNLKISINAAIKKPFWLIFTISTQSKKLTLLILINSLIFLV